MASPEIIATALHRALVAAASPAELSSDDRSALEELRARYGDRQYSFHPMGVEMVGVLISSLLGKGDWVTLRGRIATLIEEDSKVACVSNSFGTSSRRELVAARIRDEATELG